MLAYTFACYTLAVLTGAAVKSLRHLGKAVGHAARQEWPEAVGQAAEAAFHPCREVAKQSMAASLDIAEMLAANSAKDPNAAAAEGITDEAASSMARRIQLKLAGPDDGSSFGTSFGRAMGLMAGGPPPVPPAVPAAPAETNAA